MRARERWGAVLAVCMLACDRPPPPAAPSEAASDVGEDAAEDVALGEDADAAPDAATAGLGDPCDAARLCRFSACSPEGTCGAIGAACEDDSQCFDRPCAQGTCADFFNLSVGREHSCAIRSDYQALCWGRNDQGQAEPPLEQSFQRLAASDRFTCGIALPDYNIRCWGDTAALGASAFSDKALDLAVGDRHLCAILESGEIVCWGSGVALETTPPPGTGWNTLVAGREHTCALNSISEVSCWGANGAGQLDVPAGDGFAYNFFHLFAGGATTCAREPDGPILCWGSDAFDQGSPPDVPFFQMGLGEYHGCGVDTESRVYCWGRNDQGQSNAPPNAQRFDAALAGRAHSCAIQFDGKILCWGSSRYGQASAPGPGFARISVGTLACGERRSGLLECWGGEDPPRIPSNAARGVSAGGSNACALDASGRAVCWSLEQQEALTPPDDPLLSLAVGGLHACGVRVSDGSVACWGADFADQSTPPAGAFTQLAAGASHTCGIRTNGQVACWGDGGAGQTTAPSGVTFTLLSAGGTHTCGLQTNGEVSCWGSNTLAQRNAPAGRFRDLDVGAAISCGVTLEGVLVCWGGTSDQRFVPNGRFTQVSVATDRLCALRDDARVVCWGAEPSVR